MVAPIRIRRLQFIARHSPALALLVACISLCSLGAASHHLYPARLFVPDQLARPDEAIQLEARLSHISKLGIHVDMNGYRVRFLCPPWLDKEASTSENGRAIVEGRLPAQAPHVCLLRASFAGSAHHQAAMDVGRIFVWDAESRIFVCDIDHTLSDLSELEVPITPNSEIPALPGSVAAMGELAKTYHILYLSARDEIFFDKTRSWLREKGFPDGPLFCRKFDIRESQEAFKTHFLAELKKRFPGLEVGVGDQPGDARAYLANGMHALLITPTNKVKAPKGATVVTSWEAIRKTLLSR